MLQCCEIQDWMLKITWIHYVRLAWKILSSKKAVGHLGSGMPTTANGAPSFPITGTLKAKSETEASPSEQKKNYGYVWRQRHREGFRQRWVVLDGEGFLEVVVAFGTGVNLNNLKYPETWHWTLIIMFKSRMVDLFVNGKNDYCKKRFWLILERWAP